MVAIIEHETTADAGLNTLCRLHETSDITLYFSDVPALDAGGVVSVKRTLAVCPGGRGLRRTPGLQWACGPRVCAART